MKTEEEWSQEGARTVNLSEPRLLHLSYWCPALAKVLTVRWKEVLITDWAPGYETEVVMKRCQCGAKHRMKIP